MILKGSQRSSGGNLAAHLMNMEDNEHVRLHELRGFASGTLKDAFQETEAISRGTQCQQYLFSLSLSPPEQARLSVRDFESAIDRVEDKLGLGGQPRAVIFHEKEGRRHAHCVWSRIDAETMTARPMSFFKRKLSGISRELYLEHGWTLPRGLESPAERNPANVTLAEWQQAKRQGLDPRWIKQTLQGCWNRSDNARAFGQSLQEHGFFLAKGDRRGFVILDHTGEVYSLPRALDLKTKDVRARLGDGEGLASVAATQKQIGECMTPAIRRHIAESRERFQKRSAALGQQKAEMTKRHRAGRADLDARHAAEWLAETKERADRLPKGLRGLWRRLTGTYQAIRAANEAEAKAGAERQGGERQRLIDLQREERGPLQAAFKDLRRGQARQLLDLRRDVGRYLKFSRGEAAKRRKPGRAAPISGSSSNDRPYPPRRTDMDSRENDNTGLYMAIGLIYAAVIFVAAFFFALFVFIAFILTIIAFWAWNEPVRIGSVTFEPKECRAFVGRGVIGAVLVPMFAAFAALLYGATIVPDAWLYFVVGGYMAGSLGLEILFAEDEQKAGSNVEILPPALPAPPRPNPRPSQPEGFTFATWDDEKDRS